jgi:hypothetical protein
MRAQLCPNDGPGARVALNQELSAEGLDAIDQSAKPAAAGQVRAAAPVVADLDHDRLRRGRKFDASLGCAGMLEPVRATDTPSAALSPLGTPPVGISPSK